jgi:long-chain acyl-CoA synthetase
MNVSELSIQNPEKFGEYESLYFEGRWYTNRENLKRSAQIANGLSDLGIKRGDRVAMVLANCPEVLNTFNGCFMMGAWCNPVMFTLAADEMGYLFQDAEPTVVITQEAFLGSVTKATTRAPSIKTLVTADKGAVEGAVCMQDWFKDLSSDFPIVSCKADDVALLLYTSGTTGRPKGVMLTHDNLVFTAISASKARGIKPGDTSLSCLPLNHSYGIITWISSEYFGIKNVLMPRFEEEELFKLIQEFKCGATALVPTMVHRLLSHPAADNYDLSSLKRWGCAAAPLSEEKRKQFEERFPGRLVDAYGLTECSPSVTITRMDMPYKDGTLGVPIEGVEVSIQNQEGKILPPKETGEICVRGRNVMKGYYKRPELTAEIIRNGWLHTGDVGYLDEEDYLFITDRIKDLIIRGGENIFPKDIEEILLRHPKINEVAVIGMPDEDYGEEVMAVIVPAAGNKPVAEEITEYCKNYLGKFQIPKRIEFVPTLPRNPIGKLLKRKLREQYFQI